MQSVGSSHICGPYTMATPVVQWSFCVAGSLSQPFQEPVALLGAAHLSSPAVDSVVPFCVSPDFGGRFRNYRSNPGRPSNLCLSSTRNDSLTITDTGFHTLMGRATGPNLSWGGLLPRSSNSFKFGTSRLTGTTQHTPRAGKSCEVLVNLNSFNKELLSRINILKEPYRRPLFLSNCHVETIFASFFRSLPKLTYERECLEMADGGTVAVDWPISGNDEEVWRGQQEQDVPVLILLPGLTGGSGDTYVRHMLIKARKAGWRVAVFNSRGCADSPVTTSQFYSASFTEDLRQVVKHVGSLYNQSRVYAVGWSLGANILVRYIGQEGENCPLAGAVSLCNPFNLVVANESFHTGFNNVYDRNLASALGKIFAKHASLFEGKGGDYNVPLAANAKSVRDFDEGITRVSFGFKTVDEYYFLASSSRNIKDVRIPLLCIQVCYFIYFAHLGTETDALVWFVISRVYVEGGIHDAVSVGGVLWRSSDKEDWIVIVQAKDDPIAPAAGIPRADIEANLNCALVVSPSGGHLGWTAGPGGPRGAPWTDPLVMDYLVLLEKSLQAGTAF